MENHPLDRDDTCDRNSLVNRSILTALLDIGDPVSQRELRQQLHNDLTRIAESLVSEDREAIAAATHELKGLSATIGAIRLSENAQSLNTVSHAAEIAVLDIMAKAIRQEIAQLLEFLGTFETS